MGNYLSLRRHRARIVRDSIRRRVLRGEWERVLPSEDSLAHYYAVGRNVIREALAVLATESYVRRVQGSGTHPTTYALLHELNTLRSFTEGEESEPTGRVVRYRTLDWSVMPASSADSELLRVAPGDEIVRWERVTFGPEPLTLWSSVLRGDLGLIEPATETDFLGAGTFALLEAAGNMVDGAEHITGAAAADQSTAELLRVAPGTALMLQYRKTFLVDGTLAEVGTGYYRPDQVFIVNNFKRRQV